jgi:PBSX family phage terminase large subunit
MIAAAEQLVIPAPELRGAILELAKCSDFEVGVDGPAGTGKTFGILYYIHILLWKYNNAKILVARKHNTDLAGSAMATYREMVLDEREGVSYFGGNKVEPACFRYPNGSKLVVNGLDKPGKVRSMEFDGIYINEATECAIDDIEFCRMRLGRRRKSMLPRKQLIMDFNPDAPTHFLNQRMNEGVTTRILSRHEDNPFLWDAKTQDWTEAGREYIFGILGGLTGVRLARYRYGIWAAAEGTVYEDSWDANRNVIDPFPIPADWPRYMAIDFGYVNPFCCLWAAKDPDGRLYIYRQIYMTKRLVEDHAKDIKKVSRWGEKDGDPLPREVIVDHDVEDYKTLERHTGLYTTPAKKTVSDGIQAVAARWRPAGDGKPRLMIFRNCLVERDQELAKAKRPTCLEEEPDSYIWDTKQGRKQGEQPVKDNDHGLDPARYLVAYHDLVPNQVGYVKGFWK